MEWKYKDSYLGATHRFYSAQHYQLQFNAAEMSHALKLIPSDATVSATSTLVPHLASRDLIYHYPIGTMKAEYILFLYADVPYGIINKTLEEVRAQYANSADGTVIYDNKLRDLTHFTFGINFT